MDDLQMMKVTAVGHMGACVSFDGAVVEISRSGLAAFTAGNRSKRIPVEAITKVYLRPATGLVNGFIQFVEVGDHVSAAEGMAQTAASARSENSVVFTRKHQATFEKLRAQVEQSFRPGWQG
jgi:hypothetical protein